MSRRLRFLPSQPVYVDVLRVCLANQCVKLPPEGGSRDDDTKHVDRSVNVKVLLLQRIPSVYRAAIKCNVPSVCVSQKNAQNVMQSVKGWLTGLAADALGPVVPEGHGRRRRGGRDRVVVLADGVAGNGRVGAGGPGREGGVEAGEEVLACDQAQVPTASGRDGDGGGGLGRHGECRCVCGGQVVDKRGEDGVGMGWSVGWEVDMRSWMGVWWEDRVQDGMVEAGISTWGSGRWC